jgi:hypothetical protein
VGKPGRVVKEVQKIGGNLCAGERDGRARSARRGTPREPLCNDTTTNCIFFLDTTSAPAQNPCDFSAGSRLEGRRRNFLLAASGNTARRSESSTGGNACSTCRAGPCSASIRSAPRAATGCEPPTPSANSAAIAPPRSTTFRLRSARACACVPAPLAAIVHRAARLDAVPSAASRPRRTARPRYSLCPSVRSVLIRLSGRQITKTFTTENTEKANRKRRVLYSLEWGRVAGGASGHSGAWANSEMRWHRVPQLAGMIRRTYQTQKNQHGEHGSTDHYDDRHPQSFRTNPATQSF